MRKRGEGKGAEEKERGEFGHLQYSNASLLGFGGSFDWLSGRLSPSLSPSFFSFSC